MHGCALLYGRADNTLLQHIYSTLREGAVSGACCMGSHGDHAWCTPGDSNFRRSTAEISSAVHGCVAMGHKLHGLFSF